MSFFFFFNLLSLQVLYFCSFFSFLVISLLKMACRRRAKALCVVFKCKGAGTPLMEKIRVSDQLCSGPSYSAVACEFSVNESGIYTQESVFTQKHTKQSYVLIR